MKVLRIGKLLAAYAAGQWTITKGGDETGFVTLARCTGDKYQWTMARNNCYPFNGPLAQKNAPIGKWIVVNFIGQEAASTDFPPRHRVKGGFTNKEIYAIVDMVNLIF